MVFSTKPKEELDGKELKLRLEGKGIGVSPHATDHLAEGQRKVFKEEELKHMAMRETPRRAYLQENGRYAAYYRKSDGYRKLIFEIQRSDVTIVSFMDTLEIPRY